MPKKNLASKLLKILFLLVYFLTLYVPLFEKVNITPKVQDVTAGNFTIQTGAYVGNGNVMSISGLGFAPDLVILKSHSTAGSGGLFKTSATIDNITSMFVATADSTGTITLDTDGFTVVGTNGNTATAYYTWIAYGGSDCSSSGNFCVGSYVGNGTSPRLIDTVGFQPDLVWVKPTGANEATWRSSDMPENYAQYFSATAQDTDGSFFTTLASNGFNVGATNNTSATIYYYVAFKNTSNYISTGYYDGDATARNITVGFQPDFVFLKNSATTDRAIFNTTEMMGKTSYSFADLDSVAAGITGLISTPVAGFGVDTNTYSNGSGNRIYWAAFGGASDVRSSSGTFKMAKGTYTGTGATGNYISIDNLDFAPDLVIVKGNTTQIGVFRTSLMAGNITAYLTGATSNFANGIVSLDPNGFTIGSSTVVNTSGATYYWEAFGNAWKGTTNSGASDFYVGAYQGIAADDTNIGRLPFKADLVTLKSESTSGYAAFKISDQADDSSSWLQGTADTSNAIQKITDDGFEIGSSTVVNSARATHYFFGFQKGDNFTVGMYNGNGGTKDITTGFQPDYIWIKHPSTTVGVSRSSEQTGDGALPFTNVANQTNTITSIASTSFSLSSSAYVNGSSINNYKYVAWKSNSSPTTPTYKIQTGGYTGNGNYLSITGLGFSPDLVIIKPATTAGIGTLFKTSATIDNVEPAFRNIADSAAGITLDQDGFSVTGGNSNSVSVYHTWIAIGGSNCTSSGNFCVGAYVGNGTSPRLIDTVGFQPDLVWAKRTGAYDATWRSVSMPDSYAQFFSGVVQSTDGSSFTTLASNGFNVGATNNTASAVYYYAAFKNTANQIATGSYSGGTAAQNIDVGFHPDFVFLKNATTTGAAIYKNTESYGRNSYYYSDTACLTGGITGLITTPVNGFSVDTNAVVNGSGNTMYWAAFGGASNTRNTSGTFKMAKGTYTGTGTTGNFISVNNLNFAPDLVIVKGDTTQVGAFRTSEMGGDFTTYFSTATASFTGGIVSLDPSGFTIGNSAVLNTAGATYYWEAFGNAWKEYTNTGASDFYVNSFLGSTSDNTNIVKLPFAANMVTIKANASQAGVFRTSAHLNDLTSSFGTTAEASNLIQSLRADGFQIGTSSIVNGSLVISHYFGFQNGANFSVGSYNGSGASKDIEVGFQPDYIWVKHPSTTAAGGSRSSDQSGDGILPFTNVANVTDSITSILSTGFRVLSSAYVNAGSVTNYRYVAWRVPTSDIISIVVSDGFVDFGHVPLGSSKNTVDLSKVQSVTNNGNVAVDVSIRGYDTACPWTLGSSVGADTYVYEFQAAGPWTQIQKTSSLLKENLGVSESQNFHLRLWTPSSTSCLTEQSVNVTLVATQQ